GNGAVGAAFCHEGEDVELTGGERRERAGVAAGVQQAADDFGVERGAARGDPRDRVGELGDVGDPVLEQVTDPAGAGGEQVGGVPGLDVLGKHQDAHARVVAADRGRGAQALVGVAGRHPHVDDRDVGCVGGHRVLERLGVADRGYYLVPAVGEDLGESGPDHGGVLGDHYAH